MITGFNVGERGRISVKLERGDETACSGRSRFPLADEA
jgi:hypothetical protein